MKRLFLCLTLCVLLLCVAGCSESPGLGNEQQGDDRSEREAYYKVGEEALVFVGTWDMYTANYDYDCVFYPDGHCKVIRNDSSYGWTQDGSWAYNSQTQMLATTVDDYQWMVTVVGDDSWAGVRQREKKDAQSFTRKSVPYKALYSLAGIWVNGGDTLEVGYGSWGAGKATIGDVEIDMNGRSYSSAISEAELSVEAELNGSGTWQLRDMGVVDKQNLASVVEIGEGDIAYCLREKIGNQSTKVGFLVMTVSDDGMYISKLKKVYYWLFESVMYSRVDEYTRLIE